MGCTSSKQVDVAASAVPTYRPAPSSFAVFDINAIQEPWAVTAQGDYDNNEKEEDNKKQPAIIPRAHTPIVDKFELESDAPRPWEEISKDLESLKPAHDSDNELIKEARVVHSPAHDSESSPPMKRVHRKSFSFHTLDELDKKVAFNPKPAGLTKTESLRKKWDLTRPEMPIKKIEPGTGVKENMFIVQDRLQREREGKDTKFEELLKLKRDPLSQFPELIPPNGAESVVLYTTSLGGVRRTYEDCNRVRLILETHRVVFDERDVSLHGEFLSELGELLAREAVRSVPRLFVKGRYLGGVNEIVEMNERGMLGRILRFGGVERGVGAWQVCDGCGGARFVPCVECGGSCKVVIGGFRERCGKCNENGLVQCPICI